MSTMTISYLSDDMVEVDLDGKKRTVTREIAEAGLANAKAFVNDPALGQAAKDQVRYFETVLAYMDIDPDAEIDEEG